MDKLEHFYSEESKKIRVANINDIPKITDLHWDNLKEGLMPLLGKKVLRIFYNELLNDENSFILLYCNDEEIVGCAAASRNPNKIIRRVKLKNPIQIAFSIIKIMISNSSLPVQALFANFPIYDAPELLFLFVEESKRGKGIGKRLLYATSSRFRKLNVEKYKISVPENNFRAIRFYEKENFALKSNYRYLGNIWRVYEHNIKDNLIKTARQL